MQKFLIKCNVAEDDNGPAIILWLGQEWYPTGDERIWDSMELRSCWTDREEAVAWNKLDADREIAEMQAEGNDFDVVEIGP